MGKFNFLPVKSKYVQGITFGKNQGKNYRKRRCLRFLLHFLLRFIGKSMARKFTINLQNSLFTFFWQHLFLLRDKGCGFEHRAIRFFGCNKWIDRLAAKQKLRIFIQGKKLNKYEYILSKRLNITFS